MSSLKKSSRDYSRKHQKAILDPWRQSHNLPFSLPSHSPKGPSTTSPISTNSLSSSSPPQNSTQNLNEIHHLSNLLDINLQQAIKATNPSPPTSLYIPLPSLDQVTALRSHRPHGSLHSKGTGQSCQSKATTLLTFVIVEAHSLTLNIKHNYKLGDVMGLGTLKVGYLKRAGRVVYTRTNSDKRPDAFCGSLLPKVVLGLKRDGTKKPYVRLIPDYNTLDVADKIDITREWNFC
ncbi:hypothetical protein Tco_0824463 [Tanacetum coccineum]|uniref:Uncharacterized protein n=1 Tax=Tanacetum coccineum TaxID=301880 RepID=A0ABQ5AQU5_9ASTR